MSTTQKNEIHSIFEENELNDLKRFIVKRQQLNTANTFLRYLIESMRIKPASKSPE